MSNTPYGLSALMETINNIAVEEENLDTINDVAAGTMETMTYMDAVEAGLMDEEDDEEIDDEMEDVEDEVDPDDPAITRMLDNIPEDDEEGDLEELEDALESFIADNE